MEHQVYASWMYQQKLSKVNVNNNSFQHIHNCFFGTERRIYVLKIAVWQEKPRKIISEVFEKSNLFLVNFQTFPFEGFTLPAILLQILLSNSQTNCFS